MALIFHSPSLCSSIHCLAKAAKRLPANRSYTRNFEASFRNPSIVTGASSKPDDEIVPGKKDEQALSPMETSLARGFFRRKAWIAVLSLSLTAFIAGYLYFFITGNGADEVPIMRSQNYMVTPDR